jgi:hypothetical protein
MRHSLSYQNKIWRIKAGKLRNFNLVKSKITTRFQSMYNYICEKCTVLIQTDKIPTNIGCPKGSMHKWHKIGKVGTSNLQCKKCAILVKSEPHPLAAPQVLCISGINCDRKSQPLVPRPKTSAWILAETGKCPFLPHRSTP